MTIQEFRALAQREVTESEYRVIEKVYVYHPSISETEGKHQIAGLFNNFGMRIIRDMLSTAEEAQEYERGISELKERLENIKNKYERLKRGD